MWFSSTCVKPGQTMSTYVKYPLPPPEAIQSYSKSIKAIQKLFTKKKILFFSGLGAFVSLLFKIRVYPCSSVVKIKPKNFHAHR